MLKLFQICIMYLKAFQANHTSFSKKHLSDVVIFTMMTASPTLSFAETITPIDQVDFSKLGYWDNNALVYSVDNFRIVLAKGYSDKDALVLDKQSVQKNIDFYIANMPIKLRKLQNLMDEVSPGYLEGARRFFPIELRISVEKSGDEINATAYANQIFVPAKENQSQINAVFDILSHELGHTIQAQSNYRRNFFSETFADVIGVLLNEQPGLINYGVQSEIDKTKQFISLAGADPQKYAKEHNVSTEMIIYGLWRSKLWLKCASADYVRDFRRQIFLSDVYLSGGQLYHSSCAINSFLFDLGKGLGLRNTYVAFVKTYVEKPFLFNTLDVAEILRQIYGGIDLSGMGIDGQKLQPRQQSTGSINYEITNDGKSVKIALKGMSTIKTDYLSSPVIGSIRKLDQKDFLMSFDFFGENWGPALVPIDEGVCTTNGSNYDCLCLGDGDGIEYLLFSIDGSGQPSSNNFIIPSSQLPKGCYYLR